MIDVDGDFGALFRNNELSDRAFFQEIETFGFVDIADEHDSRRNSNRRKLMEIVFNFIHEAHFTTSLGKLWLRRRD